MEYTARELVDKTREIVEGHGIVWPSTFWGLETALQDEFEIGLDSAYAAGVEDENYSHADDYSDGYEAGQLDGSDEGYSEGFAEGREVGYDEGYAAGLAAIGD